MRAERSAQAIHNPEGSSEPRGQLKAPIVGDFGTHKRSFSVLNATSPFSMQL